SGHFGTGHPRGGLGRVRRAGGESAGEPGRRTVLDGQAGPGVHAGLGPASLGVGARPAPACRSWRWRVLLNRYWSDLLGGVVRSSELGAVPLGPRVLDRGPGTGAGPGHA